MGLHFEKAGVIYKNRWV